MSCSCNSNPCSCTAANNCDNEPLSSALNNFITSFFGPISKTCVNGKTQWVLPCNLEQGFANFPRFTGEGLACYFSRYIQAQQTGPVGPTGATGAAGSQGAPSVSVKAFNPANQSIPNNVSTALNFTAESFDTNAMHDNAVNNSRLTATIAGKYIIQGQITFNSSSGGAKRVEVRKNGTTVVATFKERIDAGTDTPELSVIQVHDLEEFIVGDFVELLAFQDSGVAVDTVGQSNFTWFGMTRHADMGSIGATGATGATGAAGAAGAVGPAGPSGGAGSFIVLQDQKPLGTTGGSFVLGAWRTRDLNTEVADTGGDATLAANQITLLAGTYRIIASAPAGNGVGRHKTRLQNITDATTTLLGTSEDGTASPPVTRSFINGRFTIAAAKTFEIQHQCQTTASFGTASSFDIEVYTTVVMWKE